MMSVGEQVWGIGWRGRLLALIGMSALALAISLVASAARAGATVPKETDIMIIFDTSGSMSAVLEEAKEEIKTLVANTEASLPERRVRRRERRRSPRLRKRHACIHLSKRK